MAGQDYAPFDFPAALCLRTHSTTDAVHVWRYECQLTIEPSLSAGGRNSGIAEIWPSPRRSFHRVSRITIRPPRGSLPGVDGSKALVSGYRAVFPDIHFTIEREVIAGDTVASHWRCRGTHRGELMGIAPTGRAVEIEGISILLLEDGRISHQTTIWDALGMMRQLGAVPATA